MNIRSTIVGLGTGILLIVLMYYPLYVVLPGNYILDWGSGSKQLVLGLEIASGVTALIGGLLATLYSGSHSRWQGLLRGASAGLLAGLLLFIGLGAAAAGTAGSGIMLANGAQPATDDLQFMSLLSETVVRTGWWTYQVLWVMVPGGVVLGALGGLLAPPHLGEKTKSPQVSQIRVSLAVAAVIASVLNYVVAAAVFALLPEATQNAANEVGFSLSLEPMGIFYWAAITAQVVYLVTLIWLTTVVQRARKTEEPAELFTAGVAGYIGGGVALALIALMFFINRPYAFQWHFLLGALVGLTLGVLLILSGITLNQRARRTALQRDRTKIWPLLIVFGYPLLVIVVFPFLSNLLGAPEVAIVAGLIYVALLYWISKQVQHSGEPIPSALEPEFWRQNWLPLSLGITLAMLAPTFAGLMQTALNLVMIPVRMIAVLANYGTNFDPNLAVDFTPVSLVRDLYRMQAQAGLLAFGVFFGISAISIWLASFIFGQMKKRQTQAAGSNEQDEEDNV